MAVIIRNKKLLLGLRRYVLNDKKTITVWTSPGGRYEHGENIKTTLKREVKEEAGIDDLEILDHIGDVPEKKEGDCVNLFLCRTNQKIKLMEPDKFLEWKWFDLKGYKNGKPQNHINENARKKIVDYLERRDAKKPAK